MTDPRAQAIVDQLTRQYNRQPNRLLQWHRRILLTLLRARLDHLQRHSAGAHPTVPFRTILHHYWPQFWSEGSGEPPNKP